MAKNSLTQSEIRNKMMSRLNTQSRLSGDKIWFPVRVLKSILGTRFEYTQRIYESLWVAVLDNGVVKHKNINKLDKLFIKSDDTVYCEIDGAAYQVYTPSSVLNRKEEMRVSDFSGIAIDHLKPIDKTLREKAAELSELQKVSDMVKSYAKSSGLTNSRLELAFNKNRIYKPVDEDKLIDELYKIFEDSHYRLMQSDKNGEKSNVLDYKEFYKKNNSYYALIDDTAKDASGNPVIIYQNLSNDYLSVIQKDKCPFGQNDQVAHVAVPIDLL